MAIQTRSGRSNDTNASSASRCPDDDPDGLNEYQETDDSDASEDQASPIKPQPKKRQGKPKRDSDDDESSEDELVSERNQVLAKRNATRTTSKPPPKSRGKTTDSQKTKSKTSGTAKKGGKGQNSDLTNPVSDRFSKDKEKRRATSATDMQKSGATSKQAEAVKSIAEQFEEYKRVAKARILQDEERITNLMDEKAMLMEREEELLEERDQLVEVIDGGHGSDYEHEEDNEQVKSSEHSIIKNATKLVYRTVKFINNEEQQRQFGEMVMDKTQLTNLQFSDKDTTLKNAEVKKARASFRKKWEKVWLRIVNEQRNYNQSEMRKACIEYMNVKNAHELPPDEWLIPILKRDFSEFDPNEGDSDEILTEKATNKANCLAFFDFYVNELLPCCAGTKMWHADIRHTECVSQSRLPNSRDLRVSAATEAMCALIYKNGRNKWIAMHIWYANNPQQPGEPKPEPPRWNNKKKEENLEFKSPYSDPYGGQNKFGGWNKDGRRMFVQYGKLVKATRENKTEQCIKVETECFKRLFAQNKAYHDNKQKKKKRKAKVLDKEEDEDDEWSQWI